MRVFTQTAPFYESIIVVGVVKDFVTMTILGIRRNET
jgi:hypothetical protein